MPTIEIPDIEIKEIYIPDVPEIYSPHYIEIAKPPEIDVPGCTYQHRDIKNTGNRNLLLDDPNGVYTTCDFPFPSFIPLDYSPENLVITEEVPVENEPPLFQKQSSQRFLTYHLLLHQIFLLVLVKMTSELEIFVTIKN